MTGRRSWFAVAAFAIAAASLIAIDAPLEWDETVYALRGRGLLTDFPQTGWGLHRPPGLPVLAALPALTGATVALRLVGLVGGVLLVAVTARLAASVVPRAGLVALGLVAASPSVLVRSSQLLNDVWSAAFVVIAVWVLWRELEQRDAPGWGLVMVPVALLAAFFLRYGSLVFAVLVVVSAVAVWPRGLVRSGRVTAVSATVGIAGFGLHLIWSAARTGDPFGVLRLADALAPPTVLGDTLATYLGWIPWTLAGAAGLVGVVVGVAACAMWVVRGGERRRLAVLLGIPSLAGTVFVSAASGPDPRFLILPVTLLTVAAAIVVAEHVATPGVVAAVLVGLAVVGYLHARDRVAVADEERAAIVAAAEAIGDEAPTTSCGVLAWPVPIVTWYSGCATEHFGAPPESAREELLPQGVRYLLLVDAGRDQPTGPILDDYLARTESVTQVDRGGRQVEVRRFR